MTDINQVRINELARELEVKAKAIIDLLPGFGVTEKKTHSSSIPADVAEKVRTTIQGQAQAEADAEARAKSEKEAKDAAAKAALRKPAALPAPVAAAPAPPPAAKPVAPVAPPPAPAPPALAPAPPAPAPAVVAPAPVAQKPAAPQAPAVSAGATARNSASSRKTFDSATGCRKAGCAATRTAPAPDFCSVAIR